MKLPILPFLKEKEQTDYYLALVLRNEKANAVILEQTGRRVKILSHHEEYFDDSVENVTLEDLLNILDKAISSAEEALPPNIETQKTVFGLKSSWISDGKIKKEYLDKLKKICDELGLTPIGFLTLNEAIVSLIQKEEGAPITAILAEIGKKYATVSLIKAGKILEVKSSEIHQSASYTIDTLLKHFESPEILPSKIILFGAEEELAQELISHQWSKSLPFLHLPQIVNLNSGFDANSMLFGVAAQMGLIVVQAFTRDEEEIPQMKSEEFTNEEIGTREEETIKPTQMGTPEEPATENEMEANGIEQLDTAMSAEYFGFLENEDVAKIPLPKPEKEVERIEENPEIPEEVVEEQIEQIPENVFLSEERENPIPARTILVLPKIKSALGKLLKFAEKLPLKNPKNLPIKLPPQLMRAKFVIIPAVFVLLIIVVLFFYLFDSHAVIALNVKPNVSEKSVNVTFSPSAGTDIPNNTIASQFVNVTENGTDTTAATGQKETGNKAQGAVTVFNNSDSPITLPSGTVITSSNGLNFTLNNSISVASASGDPFTGTKPSTVNVNVTAETFGTNYNLPSNTVFSIGNNPSIAAKNDNPLSGGTKKQITVVSTDDINKLLSDLPKKLEGKAKSDIMGKLSQNQNILPNFASEDVTQKTFDKNAGDQANQVTLTGTVSYQGVAYDKNDMVSLASSLFSSSNITINKDNLNVKVQKMTSNSDNTVGATLNIQAVLLPKIDDTTVTKELNGMSVSKAVGVLSGLPQVTSINISISPSIPFLPKILPRNPQNIKIVINLNG